MLWLWKKVSTVVAPAMAVEKVSTMVVHSHVKMFKPIPEKTKSKFQNKFSTNQNS